MAWEDAPSHVCRGGDARGLTFCCPPIKPCPVLQALNGINLSPQEYVKIKEDFAKKTRLGNGEGTCFGSLVWCCKPSKPCPLRDSTMAKLNMGIDEYMNLKKQLSEELLGTSKVSEKDTIKSLAEMFNVSEQEAADVLKECNNDLRTAMKAFKLRSL